MFIGTVHAINVREYYETAQGRVPMDCSIEINGNGWHLEVDDVTIAVAQTLVVDGLVQIEQDTNRRVKLTAFKRADD